MSENLTSAQLVPSPGPSSSKFIQVFQVFHQSPPPLFCCTLSLPPASPFHPQIFTDASQFSQFLGCLPLSAQSRRTLVGGHVATSPHWFTCSVHLASLCHHHHHYHHHKPSSTTPSLPSPSLSLLLVYLPPLLYYLLCTPTPNCC